MKKNLYFFRGVVSLALTLSVSTTAITVSYANELENQEVIEILDESLFETPKGSNQEKELKKDEQDIENVKEKEVDESIEKESKNEVKEENSEEENTEENRVETNYNKKSSGTHIPYIYGNGSTSFNPSGNRTRQEAFILFLRAIEISETEVNPPSHPIEKVFKELEDRNIKINSYQKTGLKDEITRGEIAALVDGYLKLSQVDKKISAKDINNSMYKQSIENVLNHSVMNVDNKGNFNPEKKISRAEIITVLNKIQNRQVSKESVIDIPQIFKDVPKTHWAYPQILAATVHHTVNVDTDNQKWTSHILTGEDYKKIEETKTYNNVALVLINNGIKNPNNNQLEAIRKMNDYIANSDEVRQNFESGKSIIFAFEGAGDYLDKWSKTAYHNEGRYGAMFIVVKNKEVAYITANGSTLPDNPSKGINIKGVRKTVRTLDSQRENISYYRSGNHKSYPGLIPYNVVAQAENSSQKVKSLQGLANDGYKLNIHAGRSDEGLMSDGCLTIKDKDYLNFSKTVGFMPDWVNDNNNNFNAIYKIGKGQFVPNVQVTLVLDRTLMDESVKNKFWKN